MKLKVLVDYRERQSGIVGLLEAAGIVPEVCSLKSGDYLLDGRVALERKTTNDFVVSVMSGRLFRQAGNLASRSAQPLIVIEGNPFATEYDIHKNAVHGAIVSVSAIFGIPVLFTRSLSGTVELIRMLLSQLLTNRRVSCRVRPKYRTIRSKQLYLLQGLPSIGPNRAEVLLEHFGSAFRVFNATVSDISSLSGFGKKLADKIFDVLHAGRV